MPQAEDRGRSRREDHLHGVARLSPVSVRARAVIPYEEGIVVSSDRHRGERRLTLPGGRVKQGESAAGAAMREVHEETGLEITVGPLIYVCEVVASARRQDVNLIFLGHVVREAERAVEVVRPEEEFEILPPILDQIRCDQRHDWEQTTVWLGNVWRGDPGR